MDSLSASSNGSEMCNNTFSKEQIDQILIALSSTGMASMLTCFTGVLIVMILKLYKKFAYRLATYQVLAALFFSFTLSLELMALHYDSKSKFSKELVRQWVSWLNTLPGWNSCLQLVSHSTCSVLLCSSKTFRNWKSCTFLSLCSHHYCMLGFLLSMIHLEYQELGAGFVDGKMTAQKRSTLQDW